MKKIKRLKDPFLYAFIVDLVGFLSILTILAYYQCFEEHFFASIGFCAVLLGFTLFRAMWASISFTLMNSLRLLRIIVFNINIDIRFTKLYVRVFGNRNLYRRRTVLLRKKKKRAKDVYKRVVRLIELLWASGHNTDTLFFVMSQMLAISDEMSKLSRGYHRKRTTK